MMEQAALGQAAEMASRMGDALSLADKEYVVQFAFRTGDRELVNKLAAELMAPDADREAVYRRFQALTDFKPDWIRGIEDLLVSLEMYRIQEEKAVKTLAGILSAYGTGIPEKKVRELLPGEIREYTDRAETMQR